MKTVSKILLLGAVMAASSCAPNPPPQPVRHEPRTPRPTIFEWVNEIMAEEESDKQKAIAGEITREEFLMRNRERMDKLTIRQSQLHQIQTEQRNQNLINAIESSRYGY